MFPQYILTKIKYILNNVYIIPLTKKQKFDQRFIVKNYWGGVTTPQAPPVATPLKTSQNKPTTGLSLTDKTVRSIVNKHSKVFQGVGKLKNRQIELMWTRV